MQLKPTSANYERIKQLGLDAAALCEIQRPSAMEDWMALVNLWHRFELDIKDEGYDIFKAWGRTGDLGRRIRLQLHWLSARMLPMRDEDTYKVVAFRDTAQLEEKNAAYGESWKRRGGVGAFMMLARKWDRLDNILSQIGGGPALLTTLRKDAGGIQDDVGDLRRYLLLVEEECERRAARPQPAPDVRQVDLMEVQTGVLPTPDLDAPPIGEGSSKKPDGEEPPPSSTVPGG